VRPNEVTGFDDTEAPSVLDKLVTAAGGEAVDWPCKVECCGGGLNLTRTDVVARLSGSIMSMAQAAGAQCIAVACPMCQTSLDLRQKDIEKAAGRTFRMPVLYLTQLLGLCLDIPQKDLGLGRLVVDPAPVLKAIAAT
jgi:heterodisulfide reductase subunit B